MPGTTYVIQRKSCPACRSTRHKSIYECGFLEAPIRDYLSSFYSSQGGIAFEYLEGAKFVLDECFDCGMVFQREIPNSLLMKKLYEEWIDPEKAFEIRLGRNDFGTYSRYAREVIMLICYFRTSKPSQLRFLDFGMGWGYWLRMAEAFGCDSYGTEVSESRIKHVKSKGMTIISWEVSSQ